MRNEELLIRTAVKIVEENNKIYKTSARERVYIIYATDSTGTVDRYITVSNVKSELEWKQEFEKVGFSNVRVQPFDVPGDLDFSEVNVDLLKHSNARPKIDYTIKPTKNNPFEGSQSINTSDLRFGTISYDRSNSLQEFVFNQIKEPETRIRSGFFSGSLENWFVNLFSNSNIEQLLKEQYPYMGNSSLLQYLFDKQHLNEKSNAENYKPTDKEIIYFKIEMYPLIWWISEKNVRFADVPEKRIKEALNKIIDEAKNLKKNKQYGKTEMEGYYNNLEGERMKNQDNTRRMFTYLIKSMV